MAHKYITTETITRTEFAELVVTYSATRLPVPQETYSYNAVDDNGAEYIGFFRVHRQAEQDGNVTFTWFSN
jgi:aromatic ring hydroxylase